MPQRALAVLVAAILVACTQPGDAPSSGPAGLLHLPTRAPSTAPPTSQPPTPTPAPTETTAPTATPSPRPSPSPTPTPVPAAEIATKMLAAIAAQTGWSDQVVLSGTVRSVGSDGAARDRLANSITARAIAAPNKRELVMLEGFTDKPTLHTVLIGPDLYTEVAGVGWEKGTAAAFTLTPSFIHESFFGPVTLTA